MGVAAVPGSTRSPSSASLIGGVRVGRGAMWLSKEPMWRGAISDKKIKVPQILLLGVLRKVPKCGAFYTNIVNHNNCVCLLFPSANKATSVVGGIFIYFGVSIIMVEIFLT
jgi:hypothetical protein